MSNQPHSTETSISNIATNIRHFMWNDDYIELLAHKLDLQKVRTLVDIGSGAGILSGLFALYMRAGATVYGFDTDPEAVAQAQAFADAKPYSVNFKFAVADPYALPIESGQADMAICQHVLKSVADPAAMLAEMCRVVRPGGKVVAFEPNSLVQSVILDSVYKDADLEQRLNRVRYQAYYERGKRLMGDGDDSVGDRLPYLFMQAGLKNIEVRLSDKAAALVPPYDTEEKRARVHDFMTWLDSYRENRDYIRACFLKGGGTEAEFEAYSAWEIEQNERVREQIAREEFVYPGGLLTYIVIGEKV